jgi:Ca2+-binding EF-hand superfamily protein
MGGVDRARSKTPVRDNSSKVQEWLEAAAGLTGSSLETASEILSDKGVTTVAGLKKLHQQNKLQAYFSDEPASGSKIAKALNGSSGAGGGPSIAWPQIAATVAFVLIALFAGGLLNTEGTGNTALAEAGPSLQFDELKLKMQKQTAEMAEMQKTVDELESALKKKDKDHAIKLAEAQELSEAQTESAPDDSAEVLAKELSEALKAKDDETEAALKAKEEEHAAELKLAMESLNTDGGHVAALKKTLEEQQEALKEQHAAVLKTMTEAHSTALADAQGSCKASQAAQSSDAPAPSKCWTQPTFSIEGTFLQQFDADGDGKLELEDVLKGLDKDGNGVVGFDDLFNILDHDGDKTIEMEDLINHLDQDGDGDFDSQDVAAAYNQSITPTFNAIDADGSGGIDKEEFGEWVWIVPLIQFSFMFHQTRQLKGEHKLLRVLLPVLVVISIFVWVISTDKSTDGHAKPINEAINATRDALYDWSDTDDDNNVTHLELGAVIGAISVVSIIFALILKMEVEGSEEGGGKDATAELGDIFTTAEEGSPPASTTGGPLENGASAPAPAAKAETPEKEETQTTGAAAGAKKEKASPSPKKGKSKGRKGKNGK